MRGDRINMPGNMQKGSQVLRKPAVVSLGALCLPLVHALGGGLLFLLCAVLPTGLAQGAPTKASQESQRLAVQIVLDRAGFSVGEIDGRDGSNLRKAVQQGTPVIFKE
jgi:hypothetical protein